MGGRNSGAPGKPKTAEHKARIQAKQKDNIKHGKHILARVAICVHCGFEAQENMINLWHNDKCRKYWSYKSRKLLECT
jgi:predicted Zn-ribbon and HTH transcriptional regulator